MSQRGDITKAANSQARVGPKTAAKTQEQQSVIHHKLEFCFGDLDRSAPPVSEWFDEWDKSGLTSKLITMLKELSDLSVEEAKRGGHSARLVIYNQWPDHTRLKRKSHFSPEWRWARLRLGNLPRVIGHMIGNKFYVVFLDKDHRFWPSER